MAPPLLAPTHAIVSPFPTQCRGLSGQYPRSHHAADSMICAHGRRRSTAANHWRAGCHRGVVQEQEICGGHSRPRTLDRTESWHHVTDCGAPRRSAFESEEPGESGGECRGTVPPYPFATTEQIRGATATIYPQDSTRRFDHPWPRNRFPPWFHVDSIFGPYGTPNAVRSRGWTPCSIGIRVIEGYRWPRPLHAGDVCNEAEGAGRVPQPRKPNRLRRLDPREWRLCDLSRQGAGRRGPRSSPGRACPRSGDERTKRVRARLTCPPRRPQPPRRLPAQ